MENSFKKIVQGYQVFRDKYTQGDHSIMRSLAHYGQQPNIMVVACCDSRVDPALILQCEPGDLFVVRNVANIVPPYEKDSTHHGTSAALEFGICLLRVKHLILLGHSQCGGIQMLLNRNTACHNDFIDNWMSVIRIEQGGSSQCADDYAKLALQQSYQNCMTFPWIQKKVAPKELIIHLWFFDIKSGQIFTYSAAEKSYRVLDPQAVSYLI